MKYLLRAFWREQLQHPWQLSLCILSVAIGVAVMVGVDVANKTALKEFHKANELTDGVTTHRIIGDEYGIDQKLLRKIKVDLAVEKAYPVIQETVNVVGYDRSFELVGVDMLTSLQISSVSQTQNVDYNLSAPWRLFSTADFQSNQIELVYQGHSQLFEVVSVSHDTSKVSAAVDNFLFTDIPWAQIFLNKGGKLDRIDLVVADQKQYTNIEQSLPDQVRMLVVDRYNTARSEMTRAFQTNLIALSLLSILIAMFLIYSSVRFQVVRRREMIGLLRSTGVSGINVAQSLILEVLGIAIVGTIFGVLLGIVLAEGLTALVNQTINALYFSIADTAATLPVSVITKAVLVGCGATLLAAAVPIWRYAIATTHQLLTNEVNQQDFKIILRWGPRLSLLGIIVGGALIWLPVSSLIPPFAGLFLIVISMAILVPVFLNFLCRIVSRIGLLSNRLLVKMSIRNVCAYLGHTSVAISALSIAVSASLGVSLMIGSFRLSVDNWLEQYLRADIYLSSEVANQPNLDPRYLSQLSQVKRGKCIK